MSENEDENPVINPNLTQDDVLSLSAVYGLTLNKKQRTQLKGVQQGSTPDLRLVFLVRSFQQTMPLKMSFKVPIQNSSTKSPKWK